MSDHCLLIPCNTVQSAQQVFADLSTGEKTKAALIEIKFNGFPGSCIIRHPIHLKELVLNPKIHGVDTVNEVRIVLSPEQAWESFKEAGMVAKFGFLNKFQLINWVKCKYKIKMNVDIHPEEEEQDNAWRAHIDTYY